MTKGQFEKNGTPKVHVRYKMPSSVSKYKIFLGEARQEKKNFFLNMMNGWNHWDMAWNSYQIIRHWAIGLAQSKNVFYEWFIHIYTCMWCVVWDSDGWQTG